MTLNKTLRYLILGGIFAIPFIFFLVPSGLFFPFITGKNFTFRVIVEIVLAAWLVLMFLDRRYAPKRSPVLIAYTAFIVISAVADAFGVNAYKSFWSNYERMEGLVTHLHLYAYFLVAGAVLATERLWEAFLKTFLGASVIMTVYCLAQLADMFAINQGGVRVDGTMGNAAYMAVFMLMSVFIALFLAFRARSYMKLSASFVTGAYLVEFFLLRLIEKIDARMVQGASGATKEYYLSHVDGWMYGILALGVALMAVGIFASERFKRWRAELNASQFAYGAFALAASFILYKTATRGALLGILGGGILAALIVAIFDREHPRARKASAGVLAALLLVIGAFFLFKNADFVTKSPVLSRFSSISLSERTTKSRFMVWNMAWQGFKERPVLGWGHENFNYVFNKYYDPRMYDQEQWFDRTHNVFLDWLIAGGALGLLSYLSLFGLTVYAFWRSRLGVAEKAVLIGLFAGYFVHNLFVFDFLGSYFVFFSLAAYAHVVHTGEGERSGKGAPLLSGEGAAYGAAAVVAALLVGSLYYVNYKPYAANRTLVEAMQNQGNPQVALELYKKSIGYGTFGNPETRERLLTVAANPGQASDDLKLEFISYGVEQMEEQLRRTPNDARYLLFIGSFYNQIGQYDKAIERLDKAIEASPKKQSIYIEKGVAYLGKGDSGKAYEAFKLASDLEPMYADAKTIYAIGALYAKKPDVASSLLSTLDPEQALFDDRILSAYINLGYVDEAIKNIEARIAKKPGNASDELTLASLLLKKGNRARVVTLLLEIKSKYPQYADQMQGYVDSVRAGKDPFAQ